MLRFLIKTTKQQFNWYSQNWTWFRQIYKNRNEPCKSVVSTIKRSGRFINIIKKTKLPKSFSESLFYHKCTIITGVLHFIKPSTVLIHYEAQKACVFNSELNWVVFSFNVFLCRSADNCHSPRKQLILSAAVWLPLGDRTNRCRFDSRCSAEDLAWAWADLACANAVAMPTKSWTRKSLQQWGWHRENYYSKNWVISCFFPFFPRMINNPVNPWIHMH